MIKRCRWCWHGWLAMCVPGLMVVLGTAATAGTLKGRFLYDGKAPRQKLLDVSAEKAFCTKFHPVDESLVVASDGGLANVVIYLRTRRGAKSPTPPNYQAMLDQPAILHNPECRFAPHVLAILAGQTLIVTNPDPIGQAVKVDCLRNRSVNAMIPSGGQVKLQLPVVEPWPVPVGCSIHPWEHAFLVVRDNPYVAVSAREGTFTIKSIPTGTHEFQFWHERPGTLKRMAFQGGKTDRRGRAKIRISTGVTDLGTIRLAPKLFAGK